MKHTNPLILTALLLSPRAVLCADDLGIETRYWKALNEGRETPPMASVLEGLVFSALHSEPIEQLRQKALEQLEVGAASAPLAPVVNRGPGIKAEIARLQKEYTRTLASTPTPPLGPRPAPMAPSLATSPKAPKPWPKPSPRPPPSERRFHPQIASYRKWNRITQLIVLALLAAETPAPAADLRQSINRYS